MEQERNGYRVNGNFIYLKYLLFTHSDDMKVGSSKPNSKIMPMAKREVERRSV